MVGRVHQEFERGFEDGSDFARLRHRDEIMRQEADDRRDPVARTGDVGRALAEDVDILRGDADLFMRLAQGGGDLVEIDRVDLAAGQRDLAGMVSHRGRAQGEERGGPFPARDDTEQDGGRADDRDFVGRQEIHVAALDQPAIAERRVEARAHALNEIVEGGIGHGLPQAAGPRGKKTPRLQTPRRSVPSVAGTARSTSS